SVTSIGSDAFAYCTSLASVTISDSVTSIGEYTFNGCTSLASVTIPDSVTSIGSYAFDYCTSLASVTIPDSVTSIGSDAFYGCTSLASVTIPDSVTSIGSGAFSVCTSLTNVTVPQCVAGRGLQYVFGSPSRIRHLAFDATVSDLHENCFAKCTSLTAIEVAEDNPAYIVSPLDGCLYDRDQTTLLCCPRDKTRIDIPYGVTKIGNYAFAYCSNLVSVTFPVTLKEIGQYAFSDCTSLPTVAIPDGVTKIDYYAFVNCRKLQGVTIPPGVGKLSSSAFDGCDILWTEWYRTLADFAVNGRAYDLTQTAGDRAIADVTVAGNTALDAFVLKEGKVYDSVLYISNTSGSAVKVTLPAMPQTSYKTFKGASPLRLPAHSTSILTITRVAGGDAGGNVFLVTREELEAVE
ncbi:MAG: leucine-rich repeat domain-containing protein, partial [Kiritimatiellae bacterium]|nr:leucine-rich repeat domain-containing protein [Kiritimatiellia bacterium]